MNRFVSSLALLVALLAVCVTAEYVVDIEMSVYIHSSTCQGSFGSISWRNGTSETHCYNYLDSYTSSVSCTAAGGPFGYLFPDASSCEAGNTTSAIFINGSSLQPGQDFCMQAGDVTENASTSVRCHGYYLVHEPTPAISPDAELVDDQR